MTILSSMSRRTIMDLRSILEIGLLFLAMTSTGMETNKTEKWYKGKLVTTADDIRKGTIAKVYPDLNEAHVQYETGELELIKLTDLVPCDEPDDDEFSPQSPVGSVDEAAGPPPVDSKVVHVADDATKSGEEKVDEAGNLDLADCLEAESLDEYWYLTREAANRMNIEHTKGDEDLPLDAWVKTHASKFFPPVFKDPAANANHLKDINGTLAGLEMTFTVAMGQPVPLCNATALELVPPSGSGEYLPLIMGMLHILKVQTWDDDTMATFVQRSAFLVARLWNTRFRNFAIRILYSSSLINGAICKKMEQSGTIIKRIKTREMITQHPVLKNDVTLLGNLLGIFDDKTADKLDPKEVGDFFSLMAGLAASTKGFTTQKCDSRHIWNVMVDVFKSIAIDRKSTMNFKSRRDLVKDTKVRLKDNHIECTIIEVDGATFTLEFEDDNNNKTIETHPADQLESLRNLDWICNGLAILLMIMKQAGETICENKPSEFASNYALLCAVQDAIGFQITILEDEAVIRDVGANWQDMDKELNKLRVKYGGAKFDDETFMKRRHELETESLRNQQRVLMGIMNDTRASNNEITKMLDDKREAYDTMRLMLDTMDETKESNKYLTTRVAELEKANEELKTENDNLKEKQAIRLPVPVDNSEEDSLEAPNKPGILHAGPKNPFGMVREGIAKELKEEIKSLTRRIKTGEYNLIDEQWKKQAELEKLMAERR